MEAVNAFNAEMFSMIDMQPPISRAKMMSVTKSAIKAIKLYKHVVQIVEKFIKRCKPELKVPGLYVVDSIVRQSRHQFGVDKDVFGPRFLKNFSDTFQNLFHCPQDDKTKIVRVLNLWQKNSVFDMDIIQPLMDMANEAVLAQPSVQPIVPTQPQPPPSEEPAVVPPRISNSEALAAVAQLFQSPQGHELQRMLERLQQAEKSQAAGDANGLNAHPGNMNERSSLTEKLLDRFDYDDEPEDAVKESNFGGGGGQLHNMATQPAVGQNAGSMEYGGVTSHGEHHLFPEPHHYKNDARSQDESTQDSSARREARHISHGRRTRSRSRSPRRRRSRSSSRSTRHRRSRSRSRNSRRRSRSRDPAEREHDRERRQKGLPGIKAKMLSVCSTTLWLGQLDKKTQQSDVVSLLEEFGQIQSVNMIPPRGCAFIVMVHRLDAYTALNKLSRNSFKFNGKPVKIAWAFNKGLKPTHKKYWDVDKGVTYIPWDMVKSEELESYQEGGMLDPDTLSEEWKRTLELKKRQAAENGPPEKTGSVETQIQVATPIRMPPPFLPPPVSGGFLAVAPQLIPEAAAAAVKSPTGAPAIPRGDHPSTPRLGSPLPVRLPPHAPPFLPFPPERFRMPMPFPPFVRPEGMTSPPLRGMPNFGGLPRHTSRGGW
ncbi:SR-related and CTD-associated factor 4-like isoform X2 [Corythoichthys intestinalis]|uniref:SR-related and CTD-associated factor 4-like isoform X2 n=1 Tax=Corythoichthys intestinalis TaxID=161448 RepID=UPI0025A5C1E7|nr:SR-related and CTD-associated factor 4-like isoform X2 [Corythoichthys intestinalis]